MQLSLAVVLSLTAAAGVGCHDDASGSEALAGTDGRHRFVVTLEGGEPDLDELRRLQRESPGAVAAYADKMRSAQQREHPELDAALESLNARVVDRWWMSNAVTVEIDASRVPSLEKVRGVKSVAPDVPLGP